MSRGGKAFAVEKQIVQMDLFATTAEAKPSKAEAIGNRVCSQHTSKPTVPKVANTTIRNGLTDMERICIELDDSLAKVASNKGSPGPDRQTIEAVKFNWKMIKPKLISLLQTGAYHPGDIRRVWIPKASGGQRGLGIPNVIDRVVQEATRRVLETRFEAKFHENSHGFRPHRSCHSAIAQASEYLQEGFGYVVDIDLKDFFNRVHHQRLLSSLKRDVHDKSVLKLIHRMLKAKVVMPDGVRVSNEMGAPQGGPLSPLLSNIVLDELDQELSQRGLRFVRYADDCNIYVKSRRAGERVMASITRFIQRRLHLEVNTAKSTVAQPSERHFLGFSLHRKESGEVEINLSERSKTRLRDRLKELTPRNLGSSIKTAITKVNAYLQGWIGFFGVCTEIVERHLSRADAHIRRRLRAITLKQWKRKRTMYRRLIELGAKQKSAGEQLYGGRKNLWVLSHAPVVDRALNNAYWRDQGLNSLATLWKISKTSLYQTVPKQMVMNFG